MVVNLGIEWYFKHRMGESIMIEKKYNILIVEDDKEIRDGIEIFLRNQGYEVYKAANGLEGLKEI